MTPAQIEHFITAGFVKLVGAFAPDIGERCRQELWAATGCEPDDPSTWTKPFVRLEYLATPRFREAADTPMLHEAFDQLAGPGRWHPLTGLGTFPLRFPSPDVPADGGWHLEASFAGPDGTPRVNLRSRGRALLMLFLFSEVGPDDAPTLVRVGSHLDVPKVLEPKGEEGLPWMALCEQVVPMSESRPVARVTGSVGDVYLCHPFLVHSGSAHRGHTPRFMAQPPLRPIGEFDPFSANPTPVEQAIRDGLRSA
ncbi:MAG TPA: phytanoyl-CoA dioxygenase family protein [Candidatus Dormibacteraeota bacterium]